MEENESRRQTVGALPVPNAQGNVRPKQCCPALTARNGMPPGMREFWYCRYAFVHLVCPRALEAGISSRPKTNLE